MAERKPPAPHLPLPPRIIRRLCLVKTLTHQDEIMGENPILPLTFDEATPLTMNIYDHIYHEVAISRGIQDYSRYHYQFLYLSTDREHDLLLYTKKLLVYSTSNKRWYVLLLRYKRNGPEPEPCTYVLTEGWSKVVRDNNLELGDRIYFYQRFDPTVLPHYYYIINIVKKTGGDIQMVGCSSH